MKTKPSTILALFALGGFTIPAQIYFLREFLTLFNGNELVLGTTISLWLLVTGAGVWMARIFPVRSGQRNFATFLMLLLSVLPFAAIFKLQMQRGSALVYGAAPGFWEIAYSCLFAILPFCILNGYLFILLTSLLQEEDDQGAPGKAYSWESLGGLLGGALVNFVLLWHFDTLTALRIIFVIYLVLICLAKTIEYKQQSSAVRRPDSYREPSAIYISSILLILFILLFPFRQLSFHAQYREQQLILDKETPYGKVTITKSGEQLNYYGDGTLLFSSGNTMWNEESVHYAMLQRESAIDVLMVGGGISGAIPEVLKYHPRRLDYVEINLVIADLAKKYLGNAEIDNVFVHRADVRSFLAGEERKYDFCLINVPEPSTLQLNRYYTLEFLRLLKSHMTRAGVASFSLPATSDYVSPDAAAMNGSFFRTLKSVFTNVEIVPGNRNWYLGSDGSLSLEIGQLSDKLITPQRLNASTPQPSRENQFVNSYFIDDNLLKERSGYIMRNLPADAPLNRDFHPVMYRQQMSVWLSQFGIQWPVVLCGVALIFILILFLLNRTGAGLFAGGFTGASLEIIVMLAFQVAFGFVFSMAGVVIMLFMAGLAVGPWLSRKLFSAPVRRHFLLLQLLMAAMPLLMLLVIGHGLPLIPYSVLLFLITLAISLLTGMLYSVATAITPGDNIRAASRNYAADLFGSALGAFLVPVVLIPAAGMGITLFLMTIICLSATFINIWK
jgi:spermidine synthase